jgi:hypothetical protein
VADGETKQALQLEFNLNCVELALKICAFVIDQLGPRLFIKAGEKVTNAVKFCRVADQVIGLITGVIELYKMFRDEAEKYDNYPYAWRSLTSGWDSETINFYLSLGTLIVSVFTVIAYTLAAFGATGTALTAAAGILACVGPVGWLITAALFIITVITNWDDFRATVTGTLSDSSVNDLRESTGSALGNTLGTLGDLNEMRYDELAQDARTSHGMGHVFRRLALSSNIEEMSYDMRNISYYYYDLGASRMEHAKAARALRFSMVSLWMQADDFLDDDTKNNREDGAGDRNPFYDKGNFGRDYDYDGNIWVDPTGRLWWFFSYSLGYNDGRGGVWAAHCDNPDAENLEWSIPERLYDGVVILSRSCSRTAPGCCPPVWRTAASSLSVTWVIVGGPGHSRNSIPGG